MVKKSTSACKSPHCLILPFPGQGHINPMLQFSKLLQHKGIRVTLVTTRFYYKNLEQVSETIAIETISDGFDNGRDDAISEKVYLDRFWQVGPQSLAELLDQKLGTSVDCIIYDALFPWALEIAKKFGIIGAVYLTQNMVVNSIYYHVHIGKLQVPLTEDEISLPALPKLQLGDMPSFFFTFEDDDPYRLEVLVGQFSNIDKADWVLYNSFYELDIEVVDWMTKIWPKLRTIGPNIPSTFLDKQVKYDQDYGVSKFKVEDCMEWLDDKPKGSVIYVSFGSVVTLNEEQMEEIAYGLRDNNNYFLWVVRASEETKLPKDFVKKSEKGLVVTWCSQLKVLSHEAVGCFVTHCGWNSTLEALSLGVPIVAVPHMSDQNTNAKLVIDVWKVGARVSVDEKKIVRKEALNHSIRTIMDSERGKEMKSNAIQWKNSIVTATSEGGSSHKNIIEFVNSLSHLQVA